MGEEKSEFQRVASPQEIEGVLKSLEAQSPKISIFADGVQQFVMRLLRVDGDRIFIEPDLPMEKALKQGENVQLLFGLSEGLFSVKTKIGEVNGQRFSVELGNDVYRLQRRNDFRTVIPPEFKIEAQLTHLRGSQLSTPISLQTADLSAGGLSVRWRDFKKYKLASGQEIGGVLSWPGGKQIKFRSSIRSILETNDGSGVLGLQFLNLSLQDRQSLLFVCVQIRRSQAPVIR